MKTRNNRSDLWTLIIGGIFIVPFVSNPFTIDPVLPVRYFFWSVLTFCLILTVTFKNFRRTGLYDFTIVSRWIFFFAACFAVSAIISFMRATNLPEALFDLQKHILFFLFFYISSIIIGSSDSDIYAITKSTVVSGTVLALIGIGSVLSPHFFPIFGKNGIHALMANKNLYSSALFLLSPFALFGTFRLSGFWRVLSLICTLCVYFAIFLTKTRSVWLAVFVSAAMLFLVVLYFKRHREKRIFSARLSGILPLLALLFLVSVSLVIYINKTDDSSILSAKSLKIRFGLWDATMKMVWDKPFLGSGPGQWKIVYPLYGKTVMESGETKQKTVICYQRPHNDYLGILSEYGFWGFGFYALFFGFLAAYSIRILSSPLNDETKTFCLCMLYGMIGYLVISFFSFPKERIFHNVFLALMSASVVSTYHRVCPDPVKQRGLPVTWIHSAMLVVLVLCMVTGYVRMNSEMHAKKAVNAVKSGHWDLAVTESELACSSVYTMDTVSNPIPWYRGLAHFSSGRINEALIDFEKACAIHPWHAYSHNNLGVCYAHMGLRRKAEESFEKALSISPRFKDAYSNLKAVRQ